MSELKAKYIFILAGLAILTGLFLGLSGWLLAILAGWARPWAYGVGLFALSMAGGWIVLLGRGIRIVESVLGVDLDGDRYIGEPPQPADPRIIIMDQADSGRTQGYILDQLPGGEDKFMRLAAGVMQGTPFAERYWIGDAGPYTLKEWRGLRDYFLRRGLASWKSSKANTQGVELLAPGRAMIRTYSQMTRTLPPISHPGGADGRVHREDAYVRSTYAGEVNRIIDG